MNTTTKTKITKAEIKRRIFKSERANNTWKVCHIDNNGNLSESYHSYSRREADQIVRERRSMLHDLLSA